MKVKLYNQKAESTGEIQLPKEIFEIKMNNDLVHQVAVSQTWNRKQKTAHAKDRSEVRGGGRKPWRQKGTGRARVGSIRSPIWRGGGVTFGPRTDKILKKAIPIKMRRKALLMVLSSKAEDKSLLILDELKIEKPKTKEMFSILNKLFLKKGSGLVVLPEKDDKIIKSINNIEKADTIQAKDLNVLDMLNYKYIIMPKASIKVIKDTFLK